MIKDFFRLGLSNIRKRRLRSWLTMIGIFVGIASVVALISLGQGLQKYIDEEFEKLGRDKIMVQPKGALGGPGTESVTFTDRDIKEVRKVPGVSDALGLSMKSVKLEFNDVVRYFYAMGVPTDEGRGLYEELFESYEIEKGRDIKEGDKYKVVLGHYYLDRNLFEENVKLGDKILINGRKFDVVGFWEVVGNPTDDQNVYLSQETIEDMFNISGEYSYMAAKIAPGIEPIDGAEKIEKALRKSRDLKEGQEDFTVQTTEELMDTFNSLLNTVQIVLIGIAAISLLVGGIGIMNTMYTAVLERTKEIGIMKALGARNSSIMLLFLIESGILGLIGGAIGVILGVLFSETVEIVATNVLQSALLQAYFPWYLIVGSLAFSFIVGSISGLLPAYNASKQQPVDSLRYE